MNKPEPTYQKPASTPKLSVLAIDSHSLRIGAVAEELDASPHRRGARGPERDLLADDRREIGGKRQDARFNCHRWTSVAAPVHRAVVGRLAQAAFDLQSLYTPDGAYRYTNGWNIPAVVATPMQPIYDWSWFVGLGLSGGIYWAMMRSRFPHPP